MTTVVAVALTATAFSAQAQTINICDRTPQVADEILRLTATVGDKCDSVLVSEIAAISGLSLSNKGITSLRLGDFDGIEAGSISLDRNNLTKLPTGIFSGLTKLWFLALQNNALEALPPRVFSGLDLHVLSLAGNPGAPFRFTVRFQPSALKEDFTTASVRLVLRGGAPRPITVPLSATGARLSVNSLALTRGSVRSTVVLVTRVHGNGSFELSQGEPQLGVGTYTGFEIVRGPSITTASFTYVRARVFLEGALE